MLRDHILHVSVMSIFVLNAKLTVYILQNLLLELSSIYIHLNLIAKTKSQTELIWYTDYS